VELLLVNPRHVKNLPGRKTDVSDAAWLAQLLERGLVGQGSFVPDPVLRRLRDLTRYRAKRVHERTREIQRVQKQLETAGIKLDSVVSDVMGRSARDMLAALIDGERDVQAMADMAKTRMRPKIPDLILALEGRFDSHHALMLSHHLAHIDQLTASITNLDERTDAELAPFAEPVRRLCTIPGIGPRVAAVIIAEIGADMSRFPTSAQLCSWAGLAPENNESAGKRRRTPVGKGNPHLRTALCEAAHAAVNVRDSYLQARYRAWCRTFGKKNDNKALVAVAHNILEYCWQLLTAQPEPGTGELISYHDLGAHWLDTLDRDKRDRRAIRELERLGYDVTLQPVAA